MFFIIDDDTTNTRVALLMKLNFYCATIAYRVELGAFSAAIGTLANSRKISVDIYQSTLTVS